MQDDSEVRDTTTHGELGVMRNFKPMTMPERPEGLEFAGEDEIQVAQVIPPSLFAFQHKIRAILFRARRMSSISTKHHKQLE